MYQFKEIPELTAHKICRGCGLTTSALTVVCPKCREVLPDIDEAVPAVVVIQAAEPTSVTGSADHELKPLRRYSARPILRIVVWLLLIMLLAGFLSAFLVTVSSI